MHLCGVDEEVLGERLEEGAASVLVDEVVVVALVDSPEVVEAVLLREVEELLEVASREEGVEIEKLFLHWFLAGWRSGLLCMVWLLRAASGFYPKRSRSKPWLLFYL